MKELTFNEPLPLLAGTASGDTAPADNPLPAELDNIIAGYQNAPAEPTPAKPEPLPFITKDSSQNPKQEYYVRGPKKGQPKPPKKGTAPPLNESGQLSIQATTFITGVVFVTMIDMIIPLFLTGTYNFIQARKRKTPDFKPMDYEKVQMSKKQKEDLGTVADAVVRELKLSGSPTFLFFLGLAGVYFMNFILQKSLNDAENSKLLTNEKQANKMGTIQPNR